MAGFRANSQRVFRSFRRSSKTEAHDTQDTCHIHLRKPSQASSLASAASTDGQYPSTAEWDTKLAEPNPLRLHPPMETGSPRVQPANNRRPQSRYHLEDDDALRFHQARLRSYRDLQRSHDPSVEIHDGFDFGFSNSTRPVSEPSAGRSTSEDASPNDSDLAPAVEWGTAIMPRPHPAGLDNADYILKRGDWKRRGIIFDLEIPLADEEESFDIP
ncbi:hypothetical protein VTK73DRAFT_1806 [Phialemonium thermophilum]|uniref:Uncharacterized protein n=1 Tax=Phialemonium thermophilum TaxID=223376 RepID=A0ABR3X8A4_9PEZI